MRVQHQPVLALHQFEHALANRFELLARTDAIHRGRLHAGRHLVLQTHDAHLEELVDHVGEDRHELAALENWQLLVLAEVEQARAELQA